MMNGYQIAQQEALKKMEALDAEALEEHFLRFDTYSFTPAESFALMEQARTRLPIPYSNQLGGFHIAVNYEDVRKIMLDWENFASGPSVFRPLAKEGGPKIAPLMTDPPEHTAWRKIVTRGVSARKAKEIEPQVRADVIKHIDAFASKGECDLNTEFCERIPMLAIFYILGMGSEHFDAVRNLTLKLVADMHDPELSRQNTDAFVQFGIDRANEKRDNPGDDFLTLLTTAEVDGKPLTDIEIGTACQTMFAAGNGTTACALGFLFYEVFGNPELKQQLIDDPSLVPAAINELIRLHHPMFGVWRRVTNDVTVAGRDMKEGDSVYIGWASANRDPKVFPDPNTFRLDRGRSANHLGFGIGLHQCPGAGTARMEMEIALEEMLKRFPDMEVIDPKENPFIFVGGETIVAREVRVRFKPC